MRSGVQISKDFPVGDARCHPLTIMDGFSRYLLRCEALRRPLSTPVQKVFESTFREFGLPQTIRTDNGPPFSTLAPGGLSRLAVWWIRLGIRPERILPGRPDQNGRHERMHSTLKAETARPPRSTGARNNTLSRPFARNTITSDRMRRSPMPHPRRAISRHSVPIRGDSRTQSIRRTFVSSASIPTASSPFGRPSGISASA
jgi:transposase InsO family protein